jgi:hypothetical protein
MLADVRMTLLTLHATSAQQACRSLLMLSIINGQLSHLPIATIVSICRFVDLSICRFVDFVDFVDLLSQCMPQALNKHVDHC